MSIKAHCRVGHMTLQRKILTTMTISNDNDGALRKS